jgi:hypothetical protein
MENKALISHGVKPISKNWRKAGTYWLQNKGAVSWREALLHVGFKPKSVDSIKQRMNKDPRFAQYMKDEEERLCLDDDWSAKKATKLLEELRANSETADDRTNLLGAIKELNRIHGLYDAEVNDDEIVQEMVTTEDRRKALLKELELLDQIDKAPICIAE